ncbi:MAG: hypothetical protein MUP13_11120, partial [Thermoanaerobaculales bacterium]|nr:hypothetical protein [Thermoanaerobaculales bacterium]
MELSIYWIRWAMTSRSLMWGDELVAAPVLLELEAEALVEDGLLELMFGHRHKPERKQPVDPFQVLDRDSVGMLVKTGIEKGRSTKPDLKVGICGEHGGEPNSVEFCHVVGMNYV